MTDINRLDSVKKFWAAKATEDDENDIFEIRNPKGDAGVVRAADAHNQAVCNLANVLEVREGLQKRGILLDDTAIAIAWLLGGLKNYPQSLEDEAMELPF